MINSKLGVPKDVQVLVYEGKQVDDDQKELKYYGIHTESQIHLVLRDKGGSGINSNMKGKK